MSLNQEFKNYETIKVKYKDNVASVILNRPEVRNAFNNTMIKEITDAYTRLSTEKEVRVIVMRGEGKALCSGADLNWMRDVAKYSFEDNLDESLDIAKCMYAIYSCPKPTIARAHGAVIGGGTGLVSAHDMAFAADDTVFSLSEVKIGVVPACIAPYVVKRIGEVGARELMLSGERINGTQAEKFRLVNESVPLDKLDALIDKKVTLLKSSGPNAVKVCKQLLYHISNTWTLSEARTETARMIAELRASSEGQEGMAAFLEKRKPGWVKGGE